MSAGREGLGNGSAGLAFAGVTVTGREQRQRMWPGGGGGPCGGLGDMHRGCRFPGEGLGEGPDLPRLAASSVKREPGPQGPLQPGPPPTFILRGPGRAPESFLTASHSYPSAQLT